MPLRRSAEVLRRFSRPLAPRGGQFLKPHGEETLVPAEIRSRPEYGGYAFTFRFDDIGWILDPLD